MKNSFSRVLTLAMAALCMLSCSLTAAAATPDTSDTSPIQPYYTGFRDIEASLDIYSNDMASCYGATNVSGGYTGDITVTLQSSKDGSSWSDIKTWTSSGNTTVTVDKFYFVARGYQYRLEVVVHSYDANENIVDTGMLYSNTVSHY